MSIKSKTELNKRNAYLETQIRYALVRFDQVMAKNAKLNERLARRRNGFCRRLWLRWRALWRGKL